MIKRILMTLWAILLVTAGVAAAADQVYFYHTDPAGTPLAMTNASGAVVWQADYKPFGEENTVTADPKNNKRFVGKEKDEETGLSYFGARYEDAKTGRFVAVDPVRAVDANSNKTNEKLLLDPQRLNTYSYALNNPYRYVDKQGLWGSNIHSGTHEENYGTYIWLKKIGVSENVSAIIAFYNDATDGGKFGGGTGFAPWGEQWRHFNINPPQGYSDSRVYFADKLLTVAVNLYRAGKQNEAYKMLGQGLHSLQDLYAHRDYVPLVGGTVPHDKWYDDVSDGKNSVALINTENATKKYINTFMRLTGK